MIRTQLYLPEKEHEALLQVARQKGQSMAETVRSFIKTGLRQEKGIDRSGITVMRNLLKLQAKEGPIDLSKNIDHYLYGAPKKP